MGGTVGARLGSLDAALERLTGPAGAPEGGGQRGGAQIQGASSTEAAVNAVNESLDRVCGQAPQQYGMTQRGLWQFVSDIGALQGGLTRATVDTILHVVRTRHARAALAGVEASLYRAVREGRIMPQVATVPEGMLFPDELAHPTGARGSAGDTAAVTAPGGLPLDMSPRDVERPLITSALQEGEDKEGRLASGRGGVGGSIDSMSGPWSTGGGGGGPAAGFGGLADGTDELSSPAGVGSPPTGTVSGTGGMEESKQEGNPLQPGAGSGAGIGVGIRSGTGVQSTRWPASQDAPPATTLSSTSAVASVYARGLSDGGSEDVI